MEIKGFTYGFDGREGDYRSKEGRLSRQRLFETGVNWICLCFVVEQDDVFSRTIRFRFGENVSDRDLMEVIADAHKRGIKVCLKPTLNSADGIWRARITFPDSDMWGKDRYWDEWFKDYSAFMCYYAKLAEETQCEMLCVGCEMLGTEHKEEYWRRLISDVRLLYHGKLSYNANHGHEEDVHWFDAVDYVGTSAYFPVGSKGHISVEEMAEKWKEVRDEMRRVHERWNKPVLFMEIGCRSASGCSEMPWDFEHTDLPHDEEEQANFYESCLQVFSEEEYFAGVFWWDWSSRIYDSREEAEKENGFNIHLKKAEQVMKEWYARL
ncbi:MAG: glycosyl hydrolase family 53 [Lachnospiraceae bacterium]|nr:glycosyl hydrolase family 53 [Lachnospiraceae bacterium]